MKKKAPKMLKELIVIKWLLFIVIHFGYSQNLQGTFIENISSGELGHKMYKLKKDGSFEYNQDVNLRYGQGRYTIKKDSLILDYNMTELKVNPYHVYKTYQNSADSIQIKISVFDLDKKPLSRINIYNLKSHYGKIVDDMGIAYLKFKKNIGKIKIEASDIDYVGYSFIIDTKYNYEVDMFLRKNPNSVAIKNEIEKFKIIDFTKDFLLLENDQKERVKWRKLEIPETKQKFNKG